MDTGTKEVYVGIYKNAVEQAAFPCTTCFYTCEIQVECDGIFAGVILIYCNTNPSTYILVFSCCAGTREQVTTVMYRATALLITTDGKGPCSLDVVANW